jgi:hypothetical protein
MGSLSRLGEGQGEGDQKDRLFRQRPPAILLDYNDPLCCLDEEGMSE